MALARLAGLVRVTIVPLSTRGQRALLSRCALSHDSARANRSRSTLRGDGTTPPARTLTANACTRPATTYGEAVRETPGGGPFPAARNRLRRPPDAAVRVVPAPALTEIAKPAAFPLALQTELS